MLNTIIIPNFKTPVLTRLCLRSLRKFTDLGKTKIIVVDNGSADGSLEYLKKLKWITLLERDPGTETGPQMHARALDLALAAVDTPFFTVMHTDTIVRAPGWLEFLLGQFDGASQLAGVGSWKLEHNSLKKILWQFLENVARLLTFRIRLRPKRYLRSHCACYRTDPVKKFTRGFDDNDTAGKSLHRMLAAAGFKMRFLKTAELEKYLTHLNHATMILNSTGSGKTGTAERLAMLNEKLDAPEYKEILSNDNLDN